jgi:peptide/nickel transport system substrate-binding protein
MTMEETLLSAEMKKIGGIVMKKISLLCVILILMSTLLFANGGKEEVKTTMVADTSAKEAPELAAKVASGELPPLEERLPENPLVVKPLESTGTYGGVWHNMLVGGTLTHVVRYQGYERLLRWTPEWDGVIPNLAESYEVSPDSRVFTFHLRKGLRFSDGQPMTSEDFEFFLMDVIGNETLTPQYPDAWMSGGERVKFTVIDDYSFSYTFKEPNGLFILSNMSPGYLYLPKHYLKQYHIKYNPKANEEAKAAGFADWAELFLAKGGSRDGDDVYSNKDFPMMDPWVFSVAPGDGSMNLAIAERNPYYFKVDPDGKQLPYINRIEYAILADNEVALLKTLNGEVDFHDQHIASPANKSVLYDNQDAGNYRFITTTGAAPNAMSIMFNLNHPDPERRAIFGNKDFRIGMSYAIDRQEINDIVFAGQGIIQQVSPRPESDLYTEKLAKQYTEYDIDKANEYLDKAGLKKRDAQGYRLMPNGERLIILFEIDAVRSTFIDGLELLVQYWDKVGVEVQYKTMDRSLWEERVRRGAQMDASIHRFGGGVGSIVLTDPRYWFPYNGNSFYAKAWQTWYVNPEGINAEVAPEEPPEDVKKQMTLYNKLRVTGKETEQKAIMKEILKITADRFYHIGICTEPDSFAVVNKNLVNVPDSMPWNWIYPHPAPTNPATWYYKK